ncbi:MAG: metallophosphoesterase [Rhodanobacter sp.]
MRTLLHLSDLHFGRVDETLLAPLQTFARQLAPQLVVVSGDLTQRARGIEFRHARQFLDSLPTPQIVVPGNHDVPLHNVFSRFVSPRRKYCGFIGDDLQPVFEDDEIGVIGIDTSRSLTFKSGRINEEQIASLRATFAAMPASLTRVVVSHHPFDLPESYDDDELAGRAPLAMGVFAECGVDLLLAGHLHASHAGNTSARYPDLDHAALVVQAGTAASTRGRGEANSFNVIEIEPIQITVRRFAWHKAHRQFEESGVTRFARCGARWHRMEDDCDTLF